MQELLEHAVINLSGRSADELGGGEYEIVVIATVEIDAITARRRATDWLVGEVGNMIVGGKPSLVVDKRTFWRVPALLTAGSRGILGEVGKVDVDAETGELLTTNTLRNVILENVKVVARPASAATEIA